MNKKEQRRAAAHAEQSRRWQAAEAESPLSRAEIDELLDYVAEEMVAHGHDHTFSFTEAWLVSRGRAVGEARAFFRKHRIEDDFDLIINGDPCKLFGPSAHRMARMPIERAELEELIEWLDEQCRVHGCDHTHRFTREWLTVRGLPSAITEMALLAQGAGCDCEVVMNVDAAAIYPVRLAHPPS